MTLRVSDDTFVVVPAGSLADAKEQLHRVLALGARRVVVDLFGSSFAETSELLLLLLLLLPLKTVHDRGVDVSVVTDDPQLVALLRRRAASGSLLVEPSVAAAVDHLVG